jgi:hypothetical protein
VDFHYNSLPFEDARMHQLCGIDDLVVACARCEFHCLTMELDLVVVIWICGDESLRVDR